MQAEDGELVFLEGAIIEVRSVASRRAVSLGVNFDELHLAIRTVEHEEERNGDGECQ